METPAGAFPRSGGRFRPERRFPSASRRPGAGGPRTDTSGLSGREREVLRLIALGATDRQIARRIADFAGDGVDPCGPHPQQARRAESNGGARDFRRRGQGVTGQLRAHDRSPPRGQLRFPALHPLFTTNGGETLRRRATRRRVMYRLRLSRLSVVVCSLLCLVALAGPFTAAPPKRQFAL